MVVYKSFKLCKCYRKAINKWIIEIAAGLYDI